MDAADSTALRVLDLGRVGYAAAYEEQVRRVEEVLAARQAGREGPGFILLVEHDPVITVSRRAADGKHLLATREALETHGVTIEQTDRGGDITYHGPGQLVVYPILDLNFLGLGLHDYMRLLESAVIAVCAGYGVSADREPGATGVWVPEHRSGEGIKGGKICAMGVRIRRWVSMHGLALNVDTNLDHFALIVPCGLAGRSVTSLRRELGARAPGLSDVKRSVVQELTRLIVASRDRAAERRATAPADLSVQPPAA